MDVCSCASRRLPPACAFVSAINHGSSRYRNDTVATEETMEIRIGWPGR
jgi:hypothetical protein